VKYGNIKYYIHTYVVLLIYTLNEEYYRLSLYCYASPFISKKYTNRTHVIHILLYVCRFRYNIPTYFVTMSPRVQYRYLSPPYVIVLSNQWNTHANSMMIVIILHCIIGIRYYKLLCIIEGVKRISSHGRKYQYNKLLLIYYYMFTAEREG